MHSTNNIANCLNRLIKQAKCNHCHFVLNKTKGSSKAAWDSVNEIVNNKCRRNSQTTKLITPASDAVTNPRIIAEEFNTFLSMLVKKWLSLYQKCLILYQND